MLMMSILYSKLAFVPVVVKNMSRGGDVGHGFIVVNLWVAGFLLAG